MATNREPCGCKSNDREWLEMCAEHAAEFEATHQRWNDEHFGRAKVIEQQQEGVERGVVHQG